MAGKTVSFNTNCDLCDSYVEWLAKWLSCNGETWGVGPTVVFASAAALFLYHELEATVFEPGDHAHVSLLEKMLVSSMVVGMLALMIHIWVCSMRFFQYYLDTLIRDSPNVLLEMTTAGLLGGGQSELAALGPLTRFLRQQQPQIHITVCWFLSLCYADYVRKHYCTRFNLPYLEQWQAELHERAARRVRSTVEKVNSFVGGMQQRLRGFAPPAAPRANVVHTVVPASSRTWTSVARRATCLGVARAEGVLLTCQQKRRSASVSSASLVRQRLRLLRNSVLTSRRQDVRAAVRRTPACAILDIPPPKSQKCEDMPWRSIETKPLE